MHELFESSWRTCRGTLLFCKSGRFSAFIITYKYCYGKISDMNLQRFVRKYMA